MPRCYLLSLCSGSSLDQGSNNVTLFNLIEQINLQPNAKPPPNGAIPAEMHAYWELEPQEQNQDYQMRFVLIALESGLESPTDPVQHRINTPRFRTRALGLPFPPVVGHYELRVEWRIEGQDWQRDVARWPLIVAQAQPRPATTVH